MNKLENLQNAPLVFNVYKPVGKPSFWIVSYFKRNLNYKFGKIGHFGTLDPFAEGVLLIGVQGAQKLNDYVHKFLPKTYRAKGLFGGRTTSGDLTTEIVESKDIDAEFQNSTKEEIEEYISSLYLGEYWQAPHSVSASWYKGKRLYEYAKKGNFIVKDKVKREISKITVHSYNYPHIDFSVEVSSGTYIRSFFEEMAQSMNGHGALSELQRVAIGPVHMDQSLREENWPSKDPARENPIDLEKSGIEIDSLLKFKQLHLTDEETLKYLQGRTLNPEELKKIEECECVHPEAQDFYWVYRPGPELLGLTRIVNNELNVLFNLKHVTERIVGCRSC